MFWSGLFTLFSKTLNILIRIIGGIMDLLMNIFPNSPFKIIDNSSYADYIAKINYFIPFYELIGIMEAWLISIMIYYLYSVIARWVKAIQ